MNDGGGWESGYFLSRALSSLDTLFNSKRDGWSNIRKFWEALAAGDIEEGDAAQWAREIAKRVVSRDVFGADANVRSSRALASLGLVGAQGTHLQEREYLQMFAEFSELVDQDKHHLRHKREQLAQQMLKSGYFGGFSSDGEQAVKKDVKRAMTAIEYIQSTLPPKK